MRGSHTPQPYLGCPAVEKRRVWVHPAVSSQMWRPLPAAVQLVDFAVFPFSRAHADFISVVKILILCFGVGTN